MWSSLQIKTKKTEGEWLKILTPKQMLQRLPIALAQVRSGNNSEKFTHILKLKLTNNLDLRLGERSLHY